MVLKSQSLKSNPMFWVGAAALAYGVFLFLAGGISIKAVIGIGVGGFFVLKSISPTLAGKAKTWGLALVKKLFNAVKDNPVEVAGVVIESVPQTTAPVADWTELKSAEPTSFALVKGEALIGEFTPVEHREFFKPANTDAITHLAYEAKKAENDTAVEQLRQVNDEFFKIGVKKVEETLKETKDEDKPLE